MQCLSSHAFSGFPNPDKPGSDWCFFFGNGMSSIIVPFTFFCWSSHVTSSINKKKDNNNQSFSETLDHVHNENLKVLYFRGASLSLSQ